MYIQEPPPDTSGYMLAGYIVAFSVMAVYVLSLLIRWRNLKQDLAVLISLARKNRTPAPVAAKRSSAGAQKRR